MTCRELVAHWLFLWSKIIGPTIDNVRRGSVLLLKEISLDHPVGCRSKNKWKYAGVGAGSIRSGDNLSFAFDFLLLETPV